MNRRSVKYYTTDIEHTTLNNKYYRKVLFTTPEMQLTVMNLMPGETIPIETHQGSQFVRVEGGTALVIVENEKLILQDNDIIIIPARTRHYFENTNDKPLSLYTIYSPPEHPPDRLDYGPE